MNSISILAGTILLTGIPILLTFRLMRGHVGEMPRLLLSSLIGYAIFAGSSVSVTHVMGVTLSRDWTQGGILFAGSWAALLIVWAADEGRDLPPDQRTPPDHWPSGLLGRHWRGEVPLWGALWIICLSLTPAAFSFAAANAAALDLDLSIDEATYYRSLWVIAALQTGLVLWALTGLRRAAARRTRQFEGHGLRALPARFVGLFASLGLVAAVPFALATGLVLTYRNYRLWANPPIIHPDAIRAVREGIEIVVEGDFIPGLARRFATFLKGASNARVVHLKSDGGSALEALRFARLIREMGLDTYVRDRCNSACTLAFAAGRNRYISEGASFGFHTPAFEPLRAFAIPEGPLSAGMMRWYYRLVDVDDRLVAKAIETPFESVYIPSREELLRTRFVTDVVGPDRFAASGWSIVDRASAVKFLENGIPPLKIVADRHPETFDAILERMRSDYLIGKSPREIFAEVGTRLNDFFEPLMDVADDRSLRAYIALLSETGLEAIGKRGMKTCTAIFDRFPDLYALPLTSPASKSRRDLVAAALLLGPKKGHPSDADRKERAFNRFIAHAGGRVDGRILRRPPTPSTFGYRPTATCWSWLAAVDIALELDDATLGDLVRYWRGRTRR
ncbi:MAG: hypothetical protein OEL76_10970 [Siculibacillus sp.]|nr:hypothetical protein [Siculibacillus sp.]